MSLLHTFRIALPLAALLSVAWLDPYKDAVSSGNDEFELKKYNNAKRYYEKAETYAPGENEKKKLSFNTGDADYMLESYDNALTGFQEAVQSEDRDVQKKAFLNAGNAYLKMKKYREAINSYINALRIDPNYDKAKKNIEYVLNKMKEKDKDKDKNDKDGDNKDRKQSQDKKNDPRSSKDKDRNQNRDGRQGQNRMNREQVQNILRSLQKSQVNRQKGSNDERRKLEKNW